jgi:hypothetical protein
VEEGGYDTAQVCPNGHVANSTMQLLPEMNRKYCEACGEATLTACPGCGHPIRGEFNGIGFAKYQPPAFCRNCGKPFPWTERTLEAARELASEAENLSAEEQKEFAGTIDDLVRELPRTQGAAMRFKRLATKAGSVTAGALRDVLVDIVSETARKAIWGPTT